MKTIDKEQQSRRVEAVAAMRTAHDELEREIEAYNERSQDHDALDAALEAYNKALEEARDLRDQVVNDVGEFIDEHGDRWQEGATGQAYAEWRSAWEDLDFEEVEVEFPDAIEVPDDSPASALEEAPDAPDL